MINELRAWFIINQTIISPLCQMKLFLSSEEVSKPSGSIEIRSQNYLALMIVWESGECEMEALDMNSGQRAFCESCFCDSSEKLKEKLDYFVAKVKC